MTLSFNAEIDGLLTDIQSMPNIIWAPIRHHSPQCSWQLQRLIEQEKPDVILIEGPSEAEHLLPFMCSADAKAPLAIYNYVIDANAALTDPEGEGTDSSELPAGNAHYRCFAPFSEMSPEWVAIKAAQQQDIECHFIDLPYIQRLGLTDNPSRYSSDSEPLLYDDCLLSDTDYIGTLLQQSQCRDFDTWWERFFESGQEAVCADKFFSHLLLLCLLIRRDQAQRHGIDKETLAREQFMARQIRRHTDAGKRCLVVCGGFHCKGIYQYLQGGEAATDLVLPSAAKLTSKLTSKVKAGQTGIHLIAYSLARINKAADYSAGMPDSGYYHALWQAVQAGGESVASPKEPQAYVGQVQAELAASLVTYLRGENQPVTLPDGIEAAVMAQRLAQLRGYLPGRREFRDALQSCFLKQAQDGSERHFNSLLNQFFSGNEVGQVPNELPLAPLVQDFHHQCERFKLPLSPDKPIAKTLQIYRRDKHRQLSQLLHQLVFLDAGYGIQKAGPDFIKGKDLSLVREIWQLQWQPEIDARILECSHLGNTLADAALNKLLKQLNNNTSDGLQKVISLLQALRMGLHKIINPVCSEIEHWLQQETDASQLCEAFHYLSQCYHGQSALNGDNSTRNSKAFEGLLSFCYQRICIRLPWLATPKETQVEGLTEHLNMLAGMVNTEQPWRCEPILFYDALNELLRCEPETHPQIRGLCLGILRRDEQISDSKTEAFIAHAFAQAYQSAQYCGDFLRGFLTAARGIFLDSPTLLQMLNQHIMGLDDEAFLAALPSLRFAFTTLSPRETFSLSQQLVSDGETPISVGEHCPQSTLENALALQQQFIPLYASWGGE